MAKRAVSLSHELHLLFKALQGARALVEQWIASPPDGSLGAGELPPAVSTILVLLTERLRLLDRVARGTIDPRLLLCPENEALGRSEREEEDVTLPVWSERQLARHHRAEWKRAKTSAERASRKEEGST